MTNTCSSASVTPPFESFLSDDARLDGSVGDSTDIECKADLKDPDKTQCQSFTEYTQYLSSFCGGLGLAAQMVDKYVKNAKVSAEIVDALKTGYDVVSGVNSQFLTAITDINEGRKYDPIPKPEPIPPFPTPGQDDIENAVTEAWRMFKPWLEKMISDMPSGSPWIKVIEGVISSSDTMIADLQALFNEIDS